MIDYNLDEHNLLKNTAHEHILYENNIDNKEVNVLDQSKINNDGSFEYFNDRDQINNFDNNESNTESEDDNFYTNNKLNNELNNNSNNELDNNSNNELDNDSNNELNDNHFQNDVSNSITSDSDDEYYCYDNIVLKNNKAVGKVFADPDTGFIDIYYYY